MSRFLWTVVCTATAAICGLLGEPCYCQVPPGSSILSEPDTFKIPKDLMGRPRRSLQDQIDRAEEMSRDAFKGLGSFMEGGRNRNSDVPEPAQSQAMPDSVPNGMSGLRLPIGPIEHPVNQNLLVRQDDGASVVAKYHVGIADARIVAMPDGKLKVVEAANTQATDQAFQPWTANQLRDAWLADPRLTKLNMKTIQSRRFVFIYNTSEVFIKSTRTILETMYPAVREYFSRTSIDVQEPEFPLVIVAFANDDQYQEFGRMPAGVIAYYDTIGNHVALYEQSRLSQVAPEIAVKNAISTIAHEGVHQILHNIGVQQRLARWPMWLSEGLPEFFAPTSVTATAKWKGLGATNDLRMKEIVDDLSSGERLGSGRRLKRLVDLEQLDSVDYAYSWGLVHWMARKNRDELFQCILAASKLQPLNQIQSEQSGTPIDNLFDTAMGTEHANHELEMASYLGSLKWVDPAENQTHYLVVSGSRVTLTMSPETVQEIKSKTLPLQTFRVQRFSNRTLATQAMRQLTGN